MNETMAVDFEQKLDSSYLSGSRPSIGKLAAALAKAQLVFEPIKKTVENSAFFNEKTGKKSYYADLAAVIAATQKGLATNELVVIQTPVVNYESKMAGVHTMLVHASGEMIENTLFLPATERRKDWSKKDAHGNPEMVEVFNAQTIGIANTYARRYSYQAIVGVAAEPDSDGNEISIPEGSREAAQNLGQAKAEALRAKQTPPKPPSPVPERASLLPPGDGEERITGLIKEVVQLKTKGPTPREYRRVDFIDPNDAEASFLCFRNHAYPDGTKLFGLLDLINDHIKEMKRPVIASFWVVRDSKGAQITRPIQLGEKLSFGDDGMPEIQRGLL